MLKAAFLLAAGVGIVLLAYILVTDPQVAPIEAVRAYIAGEPTPATPPPAAEPEAKPAAETKRTPPARNRAASGAASNPEKTAAPVASPVPAGPRPTPLLPPVRIAPPPPRKPAPVPPSHYLPGNTTAWTTFGIRVTGPTVVLARGSVATPEDSAGPNGVTHSRREQMPEFAPAPGRNERALDGAPYLSLIGRICAGGTCTPPFFIGTGAVLCPSELQMTGELQVWTNNYVRELGVETVNPFRAANGGFYLHGEPAPAESCAAAAPAPGPSAPALTPGTVLRKPEFRIANSQTFWKPFFLPLDQPLLIRASGTIQARGIRRPLSPAGTSSPPSMDDVQTETELYAPGRPYGALLGRLCRVDSCGEPFVIGPERTICPREAGGRHLELWINHVIKLPRPADPNRPPTFHIFEWQNRSGEFTFEIESARTGCDGAGA